MAIVVMLIPSIGTIAALYKFMISTHMFNTHLGLVLLYSGGVGFNVRLLCGFCKSVSWSYAEAGFVDGASDAQVFLRIMLPQARPGIIAVAIIQGINVWNDYFNQMCIRDRGMDHIQSQMAFLQGKAAMIPMGAWMETEMKNSIPEGFTMQRCV